MRISTISVVTVTHNDAEWVQGLVKSIDESLAHCPNCPPTEVIIVDNNSDKPHREVLEELLARIGEGNVKLRLLSLRRNYGYSGGVNIGVAAANGEVIVVSNPDITLDRHFFPALMRAYKLMSSEFARKAILVPKILLMGGEDRVNSTGVIVHTAGYGILRDLMSPSSTREDPGPVLAPHGALFVGYGESIKALGPFDTSYYAFLEDLDLGLRAWARGYKVIYVPSLVARHKWGITWGRGLSRTKYFLTERNRLFTILKNMPKQLIPLVMPSVILSEAVSITYALSRGYPKAKAEVYASVIRRLRDLLRKRSGIQPDKGLYDVVIGNMTHVFRHTEFGGAYVRAINKLYKVLNWPVQLRRR